MLRKLLIAAMLGSAWGASLSAAAKIEEIPVLDSVGTALPAATPCFSGKIEEIPVLDSVSTTLPAAAPRDPGEIEEIRVIDAPASVVVTDNGCTTRVTVLDTLGNADVIELIPNTDAPVRVNVLNLTDSYDSIWELIPDHGAPSRNRWRRPICTPAFGRLVYGGVTVPIRADKAISTGWEIGIGQILAVDIRPWAAGPSLSVGAGFGFRRFSVKSNSFLKSDGGNLFVAPLPAGASKASGGISFFSLHFPVMLAQRIAHRFTVAAGAWLNLNTYASATASYAVGDDHAKYKYKHLDQRILSLDYAACVGFSPAVCAYVRYSPHTPFRADAGPAWHPLSAGIMFNF